MSKPTQYLRHRWTHRSEFQKTKDYGKIDLDECTVTGAKTIAPDSDDELSDSGRASKRRRIEKLAEGYLKGEPLLISSARSCPQALKRTIVCHKKSSTEPGFLLPEIDAPKEPSQIWKDVEDDDETLNRLLRRSDSVQKVIKPDGTGSKPIGAEPVQETRAQSGCRPQRRLRAANVSSEPSEEAVRQAAALRNRRAQRAVNETAAVTEAPAALATPASDPSDCIYVTQSERILRSQLDKRDWLSRRKSRFLFGRQDTAESAEDAQSPCVRPSSPASHSPRRSTVDEPSSRYDRGTLPGFSDVERSPQKASYHTAPEETEVFAEPVEVHADSVPQPRTRDSGPRSAPATRSDTDAMQARPAYMQAPSTQNGTTPLMYRKRATGSKASVQQPETTAAPMPRRGNRRRVTFPSSEDVATSESQQGQSQQVGSHPPALDMSFAPDYSFAPKLNMALVEEHTNTMLPVEPESADRPGSVKRALRKELRNSGAEITRCGSEPPSSSQVERAPQPVPSEGPSAESLSGTTEHKSSKTSSSERRQTWLGTQAMVARAERELFASPEKQRGTFTPINEQTPATHQGNTVQHTPLLQERQLLKQLSQEPAPSTQAMLEAFGGFSTVKKPRAASATKQVDEPTPLAMEKNKRPELYMLAEARRSFTSTNSASDKARENRGSGLRFSISSFDSPTVADHGREQPRDASEMTAPAQASSAKNLATPAPSTSSRSSRKSALKSSNPQLFQEAPDPRRPLQPGPQHPSSSQAEGSFTQDMSSSADFPTSNFQAAQRPEVASRLLRDPSDLSQTIDDLTRDVLGTTRDLDGVLNQ